MGLSNPTLGRILLGQWSTYFASDSLLSPGGLRDAGPYASGTLNVLGSIGKRSQYFAGGFLPNTIRYESPNWGGLAFATSYSFDTETAGQGANHTFNLNPTYTNGSLMLYANHLQRNDQAGTAGNFTTSYNQAADRLGTGYQFDSGIKVAQLVDRNTVQGSAPEAISSHRTWPLNSSPANRSVLSIPVCAIRQEPTWCASGPRSLATSEKAKPTG